MSVHTSTLQTIENVISNYRDFMTKAFTKHPTEKYSPRVQMEISKLYTYAQQHAFNQFINVGEEDSKLANYISDTQKINFAGQSTVSSFILFHSNFVEIIVLLFLKFLFYLFILLL